MTVQLYRIENGQVSLKHGKEVEVVVAVTVLSPGQKHNLREFDDEITIAVSDDQVTLDIENYIGKDAQLGNGDDNLSVLRDWGVTEITISVPDHDKDLVYFFPSISPNIGGKYTTVGWYKTTPEITDLKTLFQL